MKRCIVDLKGGLGNQLFQLAFAFRLARGEMERLLLNINYYRHWDEHVGPVIQYLFPEIKRQFVDIYETPKGFARICLDHSPGEFIPDLLRFDQDVHFSGYFQNWLYLDEIYGSFRDLFLCHNGDAVNHVRSSLRRGCSALVGVHVRRGDYMSFDYRARFGIFALADAERALNIAKSQLRIEGSCIEPIKTLWISDDRSLFSDDCQDIAKLPHFDATDSRINSVLRDFCVLASSDALVITNSTFGFWAGLFAPAVQQVFMPMHWFRNHSVESHLIKPPFFRVYANQLL